MSCSAASAATICLIACHGGPADHFATFAKGLSHKGITVDICASGPALKKFEERNISVKYAFTAEQISSEAEDVLAQDIAKICSTSKAVITDVGHAFDIKIHQALTCQAPHVVRFAYYDNPEPYVPGGYSENAAKVIQAAQRVLFANSNLPQMPIFQFHSEEIDFGNREKIGIGYYPINQAEKIAKRRLEDKLDLRQTLFQQNSLIDQGQKVVVYFGGNNNEYFLQALPAFLSLLGQAIKQDNLSNLVILFQQHPGAKAKNIDRDMIESWTAECLQTPTAPKIIISAFSSDDAQTIADGALYYQTSMGPQFVLAGIPTIQVGHEIYEDILVRNRLSPAVTQISELLEAMNRLDQKEQEIPKEAILEALGINPDWLTVLERAITNGT